MLKNRQKISVGDYLELEDLVGEKFKQTRNFNQTLEADLLCSFR